MITIVWIIALVFILLIVVFAWDRDSFWTRLAGDPDLGDVTFATLTKGPKPNEALACPPGRCKAYSAGLETTQYALAPEALLEELDAALEKEEAVTRVDDGSNPRKRRYVTRSPLMRYPDTVSVEAFASQGETSQIAMFARAQIGYSDMGANKARIEKWLEALVPHEVDNQP